MFWESISSHTHAFVLLYSMFWDKFSKNQVFSLKSCFFQNFDWSNLIFDQSKSCFKNSMSLCLVRLIKLVFRSTFLFSPTWQGSTKIFLSFSSKIFVRFSSLKAGKTILSLLLFLFSCFHAYFHAFKRHFRTSIDLGFLMIQGLFSEIDHWVLMGYWYIHVWWWLIWSIWGFMKNWKF